MFAHRAVHKGAAATIRSAISAAVKNQCSSAKPGSAATRLHKKAGIIKIPANRYEKTNKTSEKILKSALAAQEHAHRGQSHKQARARLRYFGRG